MRAAPFPPFWKTDPAGRLSQAAEGERGGLRADPRDVREGARGGAPGGWAIAVARRPRRADPRRLDRGEATAHRTVVLLRGALRGQLALSTRCSRPPGTAMSRARDAPLAWAK